jgi:hypothetical protein
MSDGMSDLDGDGYAETQYMDTNADGYHDVVRVDGDLDGTFDTYYADTNLDGAWDVVVVDGDENGLPETVALDSDYDGYYETAQVDTNGDGLADTFVADYDKDGNYSAGASFPDGGFTAAAPWDPAAAAVSVPISGMLWQMGLESDGFADSGSSIDGVNGGYKGP